MSVGCSQARAQQDAVRHCGHCRAQAQAELHNFQITHANNSHRKVRKLLQAVLLLQSMSHSASRVEMQTSAQQRAADLARQLAAARCQASEFSKR